MVVERKLLVQVLRSVAPGAVKLGAVLPTGIPLPGAQGCVLIHVLPDAVAAKPGYAVSLKVRKRIEQVFGWGKTVGPMRKTKLRGRAKVAAQTLLHAAAAAFDDHDGVIAPAIERQHREGHPLRCHRAKARDEAPFFFT
mgnify:CR=1 FL=1